MPRKVATVNLLTDAVAPGAGEAHEPWGEKRTFQAKGSTSAGAGAAAVEVQASNDKVNWIVLGTISLTLGTTETSDGFTTDAPWRYIRGNVASISGTNAKATLIMGNCA